MTVPSPSRPVLRRPTFESEFDRLKDYFLLEGVGNDDDLAEGTNEDTDKEDTDKEDKSEDTSDGEGSDDSGKEGEGEKEGEDEELTDLDGDPLAGWNPSPDRRPSPGRLFHRNHLPFIACSPGSTGFTVISLRLPSAPLVVSLVLRSGPTSATAWPPHLAISSPISCIVR